MPKTIYTPCLDTEQLQQALIVAGYNLGDKVKVYFRQNSNPSHGTIKSHCGGWAVSCPGLGNRYSSITSVSPIND